MIGRAAFTAVGAILSLALAGCGGGGGNAGTVTPPAASHGAGLQHVTVTIDAPKATGAGHARHPQYVSPATTEMAIDVQTGCPGNCTSFSGYPTTVPLTPTTGGCTSTLADTFCQIALLLPPGDYSMTLTAKDFHNLALSTAQSIAFTVVAGANNVIAVTLSGIPVGIVAAMLDATSGAIVVNAVDVDHNVIVGPGAPTFTVTDTSGPAVTLVQPTATSPNVFSAFPTAGGSAVLTVTASYGGSPTDACAQPGAVCSVPFNLAIVPRTDLWVGDRSGARIEQYVPPYTGAPVTSVLAVNGAYQFAFNQSGTLFVANSGPGSPTSVSEFAPPYTGAAIASISKPLNVPFGVAFDASNDLFIAYGSSAINEYAPPYTFSSATIFSGLDGPRMIAVDAAGKLFVANNHGNSVVGLAPPYTTAQVTITNGISAPTGIAVDASEDIWVSNYAALTVTEYVPPYTGAPAVTISGIGYPMGLAFDASNNLYVASVGGNTVFMIAPPYTGLPVSLMSVNTPTGLAFHTGYNIATISP
jgi:hypothetical protein